MGKTDIPKTRQGCWVSAKTKGPGRPTRFVRETTEKIIRALQGGNFRVVAARYGGVSYETFCGWMRRGKKQNGGPYRDFYRACLEAEKQAEIRAVALILKAAEKDPRQANWWLSHRWPERWADRSRHELTGKNGKALDVKVDMTREEILDAITKLSTSGDQA